MRVYLGCSAISICEYARFYLAERKAILETGNVITRDWISQAIAEAKTPHKSNNRSHLYNDVMKAILDADVTVFDCTVPAMSVGHQITFAIEHYKPTLILLCESTKLSTSLFLAGSNSPFLTFKDYKTAAQSKDIVLQFLKTKWISSRVRFNLVLDRELNNYIDWIAFKSKISKTNAIKNIIRKSLLEDTDYSAYIDNI